MSLIGIVAVFQCCMNSCHFYVDVAAGIASCCNYFLDRSGSAVF